MPQRIHPKSASLRELFIKFSTEEQCLEYVEKMRWPDGVVRCPTCGDKNVKRVVRTSESKNKRLWFYLCLNADCHQQRSEEHTSELQSLRHLVCRLLLEK